MNVFQAFFLAILQGVTELFPISSLGHSVLIPALLGWDIDLHDISFLPFLTLLHLGTGTALVIYFRHDWLELFHSLTGRVTGTRRDENRRLLTMLVVATIPAVIIGGTLEAMFRYFFGVPEFAAAFLLINGLMLLVGEEMIRGMERPAITLDALTWKQALIIGFSQCAALFPGISRSGATMIAGLSLGLNHEQSARFSFLLATPIIFAATVLETAKLFVFHSSLTILAVFSCLIAGITAYVAVRFLMKYFGNHEVKALKPFGWYCLGFGLFSLFSMIFFTRQSNF